MDRSPEELYPVVAVPKSLVTRVAGLFDHLTPWEGEVPAGRSRNFLGALLPYVAKSDLPPGALVPLKTRRPEVRDGEGLAEYYASLRAIEGARERFTMISLGAHFGGQLVNTAFMLRQMKPLPTRLIGVEANPFMCGQLHAHFAENGFRPDDYVVVNAAIGADNRPMLFTVCNARTGAARAFHDGNRPDEVANIIEQAGQSARVLRRVLTEMSTDFEMSLNDGDLTGRLDIVSTLTIADTIDPHDWVD